MTGWAACRLHGAGLIDGLAPDGRTRHPVGLALGGADRRIRSDRAVRLSFEQLPASEVMTRQRVRVMIPLRAAFEVDMMGAAELVTLDDVRRAKPG